MRRFVSLLLVFVLFTICAVGVVPASAADNDVSVPLGDANTDGDVDIVDVTVIQRYCVNMGRSFVSFLGADVDGDGYVSIIDATFIQRYTVGLTVPYGIGTKQIVVKCDDGNDELRCSNERFDKLSTPLVGDGTIYINGLLLIADDARAFCDDVVARDSVDWFFEKYHLTEANGWQVDSKEGPYFDETLSDDEYAATTSQNLYALDLFCFSVDSHKYSSLYFRCDGDSLRLSNHNSVSQAYAGQQAVVCDFNAPVSFGNAKSFFGDGSSVFSFDMSSYKSFMDEFGYDVSDFDSIDSCYRSDDDSSQFYGDFYTNNGDDVEAALKNGDDSVSFKSIDAYLRYRDHGTGRKSFTVSCSSNIHDVSRDANVPLQYHYCRALSVNDVDRYIETPTYHYSSANEMLDFEISVR